MMTDDKQDSIRGWGARIAAVLATLPVLYVLSIGPVIGWNTRRYISAGFSDKQIEWLEAFYAPVIWVHEHCPSLRGVLDWYITLWE